MKAPASRLRLVFIVVAIAGVHGVCFALLSSLKSRRLHSTNHVVVRLVDATPAPQLSVAALPKASPVVGSSNSETLAEKHLLLSQHAATDQKSIGDVKPNREPVVSEKKKRTSWPSLSIAYPPKAKRLGIEGKVKARVLLSEAKEIQFKLIESSGFDILDNAVKQAALSEKFKVDFFSDEATQTMVLSVEFKLNSSGPIKANLQSGESTP